LYQLNGGKVVRDEAGCYFAHPMPTWSQLLEPGADQSWDVAGAVPLRAIFTLDQAPFPNKI
jgi:hypothetical protein